MGKKEAVLEEAAEALDRRLISKDVRWSPVEIVGDACVDPLIQDTKDWMKQMKEVQGRMSELGEGRKPQTTLDASPEYRELKAQYASLMSETRQISAALEAASIEAYRKRMGAGESRSAGVDVVMAKEQIDRDKRALKARLAALRDCHNNPTAPTAIKAKTEDAAAHKRVSDAIDTVELQVDIDSGMSCWFVEGTDEQRFPEAESQPPPGASVAAHRQIAHSV